MRIFVTGATGFVGSVVVRELLDAGYRVLGLARSEPGAKALAAAGAEVHFGDLEDSEILRSGAAQSDGVIHTAFIHDFSRYEQSSEVDRKAIETLGAAVAGSDRRLIVTAGMAFLKDGGMATEEDRPLPGYLRKSEAAADSAAAQGVHVTVVRLPTSVHGEGDHAFLPYLIAKAREKGCSAYVGEGANRWAGVHRSDAAQLYRLVLEKGADNARYHAVADEGIAFRDIAAVIGKRIGLPVVSKSLEEAQDHFGWMSRFAVAEASASSLRTRELLGWKPKGPGLMADLEEPHYFEG